MKILSLLVALLLVPSLAMSTTARARINNIAARAHSNAIEGRQMLADAHVSLPAAILDGSWRLPVSDGRGRDRANLHKAMAILAGQGYRLAGGVMREE